MRRYVKTSGDEEKIVSAISQFLPAFPKFSWSLLNADGTKANGGTYYAISGLKVTHDLWKSLIEKHNIPIALHYTNQWRGRGWYQFNERYIKSRFGEKKVEHTVTNGVRWCDNEDAKAFYQRLHEDSVKSICRLIDAGDLTAAISEKKRLKAVGEY